MFDVINDQFKSTIVQHCPIDFRCSYHEIITQLGKSRVVKKLFLPRQDTQYNLPLNMISFDYSTQHQLQFSGCVINIDPLRVDFHDVFRNFRYAKGQISIKNSRPGVYEVTFQHSPTQNKRFHVIKENKVDFQGQLNKLMLAILAEYPEAKVLIVSLSPRSTPTSTSTKCKSTAVR